MHRLLLNTALTLLLALASDVAAAADGTIRFSGAVTTPTCEVVLAPDQPSPARIATQAPECSGTGEIGVLSIERIGEPLEGLAMVTLEVF